MTHYESNNAGFQQETLRRGGSIEQFAAIGAFEENRAW
jgi:hypothetical protein